MARLYDLVTSWTSWWMVSFIIAQTFQLINTAGYAVFEAIHTQPFFTSIYKTYYAFAMITTILFFMVPLTLFIFTNKKLTNGFLWSGTICYLIQMSLHSSFYSSEHVQNALGWAGFANAAIASTYLFFRRRKFEHDCPIHKHYESGTSWSNFFNACVLVFLNITYAGFGSFVSLFNGADIFQKACMVLACIGFALAGFTCLFSYYETKYVKAWFMFFSFAVNITVVAMSTSNFKNLGNTDRNRLAFGWISVIFMFVSFVYHQIERKMF